MKNNTKPKHNSKLTKTHQIKRKKKNTKAKTQQKINNTKP